MTHKLRAFALVHGAVFIGLRKIEIAGFDGGGNMLEKKDGSVGIMVREVPQEFV